MEKQRRELEEKSLALQAQLLRGSERLDRFREEMHLNKARSPAANACRPRMRCLPSDQPAGRAGGGGPSAQRRSSHGLCTPTPPFAPPQEELEQWAIANRQKEDDNAALEKYKRQDDARVKCGSGRQCLPGNPLF